MISRFSWRREDCPEVDPSTGTRGAAAEHLLAHDGGNVTVLHLGPGGSTPSERSPVGQLVVVVAGRGTVTVDGEPVEVEQGDAVRWPARSPHGLVTSHGMSVVIVSYEEPDNPWRVVRSSPDGRRWVAGVFGATDKARALRDRLRVRLPGERVTLE